MDKSHREIILLAADGSKPSLHAVRYANMILSAKKTSLILFHVMMKRKKSFGNLIRILYSLKTLTMRKRESNQGRLIERCMEDAYRTIVVGRRGLSKLEALFVGWASNEVINMAQDMAVWVV
jgi:hypothetical protein